MTWRCGGGACVLAWVEGVQGLPSMPVAMADSPGQSWVAPLPTKYRGDGEEQRVGVKLT